MKSLFDKNAFTEITERLNKVSPASHAQWGKMSVAQMLAHCKGPFYIPLSEKKMPRSVMGRMIGWMIKSKLHDDSAWKQGLPTSPQFVIKDERDFHKEKEELMSLMNKFHTAGPHGISKHPHPFFGKFTDDQWGRSMYKHMDHHLRQFGA